MNREIKTCRDDAILVGQASGSALARAVVLLEHLTPGRVRSPAPRLDIVMQPGMLYCAHTGILFPSVEPVSVRASAEAWKFGLEVLRVDFTSPKGASALEEVFELVVYFRVAEQTKYQKDMLCFEVSTAHGSLAGVTVSPGVSIPVPGLNLAIEPVTNRKYGEKPQQAASKPESKISDAEAAKKVADWLDSPDTKGKIVSADTSSRPPMPPAPTVQL